MTRPLSKVAPQWWDYTTLDQEIIDDAAKLTEETLFQLSRPGFTVHFHETLEDFYLAEALEYIEAWKKATADNPCGICGPIGPTEQLPLVARIVNSLELNLKNAHFWGMDEWVENGQPVGLDHPPTTSSASAGSGKTCACRWKIFTSRRAIWKPTRKRTTRSTA